MLRLPILSLPAPAPSSAARVSMKSKYLHRLSLPSSISACMNVTFTYAVNNAISPCTVLGLRHSCTRTKHALRQTSHFSSSHGASTRFSSSHNPSFSPCFYFFKKICFLSGVHATDFAATSQRLSSSHRRPMITTASPSQFRRKPLDVALLQ